MEKNGSGIKGAVPPALDGVRVLDLTHQVAGPSATLALAVLGADVVKVVAPGDRSGHDLLPFYFNNASKRSIAVDLKTIEGIELVLEMAKRADVFAENFGPGVIERLGLGYDTLRERNPRLVYAQIKGFARDSPYERFPCWDPIAQAMSGASSVTGEPDGLPMKPGPDVGDTGTGMMAALGIVAALYQRQSSNEGQLVEVSMADNVAASLRIHYGYPVGQQIPTPRFGNGPPFTFPTSPSGLFACSPFGPNDYVHIHCGNERQWQALLRRADGLDHGAVRQARPGRRRQHPPRRGPTPDDRHAQPCGVREAGRRLDLRIGQLAPGRAAAAGAVEGGAPRPRPPRHANL